MVGEVHLNAHFSFSFSDFLLIDSASVLLLSGAREREVQAFQPEQNL
jgi:hypothetical protein